MRNFAPHTIAQNEQLFPVSQLDPKHSKQGAFHAGVLEDAPLGSQAKNSINMSMGYVVFEEYLAVIGGSQQYGAISNLPYHPVGSGSGQRMPMLAEQGFNGSPGTNFTALSGGNFTSADIGSYLFVEGVGVNNLGVTLKITGFTDSTHVTVDQSLWIDPTLFLYAHFIDPVYGFGYHIGSKKFILHIGGRLYYADQAADSWVLIPCISKISLPQAKSIILEDGDWRAKIICKGLDLSGNPYGGVFKVDLKDSPCIYYQENSGCPAMTLVGSSTALEHGRRYTYTVSRLEGATTAIDRTATPEKHETGNCLLNPNNIDYADYYSAKPIGSGLDTYEVVGGDGPSSPVTTISTWQAIASGTWGFVVNGVTYYFEADFSGVVNMYDVAAVMQSSMVGQIPGVRCIWGGTSFTTYLPISGSTISAIQAGSGGTDISGMTGMEKCGQISSDSVSSPMLVGPLFVPRSQENSLEQHDTHYSIYESQDIGAVNLVTNIPNDPNQLIWAYDIPIAKAFMLSISLVGSSYVATATQGSFSPSDAGAAIMFENGSQCIITGYTNSSEVTTDASGAKSSQPAAIGGDNRLSQPIRVLSAQQTGQSVVWNDGSLFDVSDIGKPIYWADGTITHISGFTDTHHVTTIESKTTGGVVAAAMDPVCRYFSDGIDDTTLAARLQAYPLLNRYWIPFSPCDLGCLVPNFFCVASDGDSMLYYCQLPSGQEYLSGFYNPVYQMVELHQAIRWLRSGRTQIIIYCSRSTRGIPFNTYSSQFVGSTSSTVSSNGLVVFILSDWQLIDECIGVMDRTCVQPVGYDTDFVLTSEPEAALFDTTKYADGLAAGRILNRLNLVQPPVAMLYDAINGVTIWTNAGVFRFAVKSSQGIGFCMIPSDGIPIPPTGINGVVMFDANNNMHSIVLDWQSGRLYDIATRSGPSGSGLVQRWKNRCNQDGSGGLEFNRWWETKWDVGSVEHFFLRLMESHFYITPNDVTLRNASDHETVYDNNAYPIGLEINLDLYTDDDQIDSLATITSIPFNGDLKADKKIEGHAVMTRFTANRGGHNITNRTQYYVASNRAAAPDDRVMTEIDYQANLADVALWAGIVNGQLVSRIDGTILIASPSLQTGVENLDLTAFAIATPFNIGSAFLGSCEYVQLMFWAQKPVTANMNGTNIPLNAIMTANTWVFYLSDTFLLNGTVQIVPGDPTCMFEDIRVVYALSIPFNSTDPNAQYYVQDVLNNQGREVLP